MGPRPYRSQHAPFLSTANRWQCGDTDGTETYRWKTGTKQQRIYSHSENISEVREATISVRIHTETCTLRLQAHLSRRVMACRAA